MISYHIIIIFYSIGYHNITVIIIINFHIGIGFSSGGHKSSKIQGLVVESGFRKMLLYAWPNKGRRATI